MAAPDERAVISKAYRLSPAELVRASCEQHTAPDNASGGVTHMNVATEIGRPDDDPDTLIVTVTVKVTGTPKQGKAPAFTAECAYRHCATLDSAHARTEEFDSDFASSLARPLSVLALNQCQQLIWAMGFPSVRAPMQEMKMAFEKKPRRAEGKPRTSAPRKTRSD
jgi:hypothetical protein